MPTEFDALPHCMNFITYLILSVFASVVADVEVLFFISFSVRPFPMEYIFSFLCLSLRLSAAPRLCLFVSAFYLLCSTLWSFILVFHGTYHLPANVMDFVINEYYCCCYFTLLKFIKRTETTFYGRASSSTKWEIAVHRILCIGYCSPADRFGWRWLPLMSRCRIMRTNCKREISPAHFSFLASLLQTNTGCKLLKSEESSAISFWLHWTRVWCF